MQSQQHIKSEAKVMRNLGPASPIYFSANFPMAFFFAMACVCPQDSIRAFLGDSET